MEIVTQGMFIGMFRFIVNVLLKTKHFLHKKQTLTPCSGTHWEKKSVSQLRSTCLTSVVRGAV